MGPRDDARPHRGPSLLTFMKTLLILSIALLAAAGGTAFSGAFLVEAPAGQPASFATGTLDLASGQSGQTLLTATGLRPGQQREGTITLANHGDLPLAVALRVGGLEQAPGLAAALEVTVEKCLTPACATPWRRFSGPLSQLADPAELGDIEAGEERAFRVRLSWPLAADDPALQGAAADLTLHWKATTA